jgi:hypothetical protein
MGPRELIDRLHCPFVERQRAVSVLVDLCKGLATACEQFLTFDTPVLVLVGARKSLLLAALGGRFRRRGQARRQHAGRCHSRWGCRGKLWRLGGSALPEEEGSGQERETGRSPARKRAKAVLLQHKEIRHGETCVGNGRCQRRLNASCQLMPKHCRQTRR